MWVYPFFLLPLSPHYLSFPLFGSSASKGQSGGGVAAVGRRAAASRETSQSSREPLARRPTLAGAPSGQRRQVANTSRPCSRGSRRHRQDEARRRGSRVVAPADGSDGARVGDWWWMAMAAGQSLALGRSVTATGGTSVTATGGTNGGA
uniref:Uncharacterized protein n=1 Tax=Oryza sativa subsp. japonica TaxID=39947 RepID=Q6K4X6_ORYSJ|nr:hypothetical protein [Oryza sativa Japonica Group]